MGKVADILPWSAAVSYTHLMFARLLAFSNGDLQALYDRSDGFDRRQLVLTTKEKPVGRADDPDLAEKMKAEGQNTFSLVLSSINYDYPSNVLFSWKLDGFYIVGLTQSFHPHIIIHAQQDVFQIGTGKTVFC